MFLRNPTEPPSMGVAGQLLSSLLCGFDVALASLADD